MAPYLGRIGWAGVGMETGPGVPANPSDYIPFVSNSLQGKHEPLGDIAARGLREKNFSSVVGKKWGEGDLEVNLDPTFSGYFFKMALGTENSAQLGSTGVYDHTFTVNASSTPASATVMFDKGAFREIYPNAVAKEIELNVTDGLATLKSSLVSQFPVTSASGTNTTSSGTVFTFKDLSVQFGATLAAAQIATATKVTNLNLKIASGAEPVYRSGNTQPDSFTMQNLEISGEYGLLIENQTEVTNYYDLTKRYAVFTFTGAGIGGGYRELVQVILYNFRVNDQPVETGIDSLFALKSNLVGEYSTGDSKAIQVVCRNRKSTTY